MLISPLGEGKSVNTKAKAKTRLISANASPGPTRITDMSTANRRVVGDAQSTAVLQTN